MCHTGLGRGQAAEVQPSPCCLDDIIPHTFIFIHTHSPKTWTNTAVTDVLFRTETFESINDKGTSYQIQLNVLCCVTRQLSCLCHAQYSHMSDNHGYNSNQSKDCHHYHLTDLTFAHINLNSPAEPLRPVHSSGVIPRLSEECAAQGTGGRACLQSSVKKLFSFFSLSTKLSRL